MTWATGQWDEGRQSGVGLTLTIAKMKVDCNSSFDVLGDVLLTTQSRYTAFDLLQPAVPVIIRLIKLLHPSIMLVQPPQVNLFPCASRALFFARASS
jgi:hypothetical protein